MTIERVHIRTVDNPITHNALFELDHPYVEDYWLSAVGPTCVAFLRYVARNLDTYTDPGETDDSAELASLLGLVGTGRWSALIRTLDRLEHFRLARWDVGPAKADTLVAITVFGRVHAVPPTARKRWSEHRKQMHQRQLIALVAAQCA